MFKKYSDVISGTAIVLFSALFFYASTKIRVFAAMEGLSSRFFPRIVVGVLAFLGMIVLLRGLVKAKAYVPDTQADAAKGLSQGALCAIETIVAIFVYVMLLEPIGFLIPTVVYLFAQILILSTGKPSKKSLALYAGIALVTSCAIYFIFTRVFYLMLPAGILG